MIRKKIGEKPSTPMTTTRRSVASSATSAASTASKRVERWRVCSATATTASAEQAMSAEKSAVLCGKARPTKSGPMKISSPAIVMASNTSDSPRDWIAVIGQEPLPATASHGRAAC